MTEEPSPTTTTSTVQCRVCTTALPEPFIDLGHQPLANAFVKAGAELTRYPLAVSCCQGCGTLQLTFTPDPDEMFLDYAYMSSVSSTWVAHCTSYIDSLIADGLIGPSSTVVEIASNDGFLIDHMRSRGLRGFGVEPAKNLAALANERGSTTFNEFMGRESALRIKSEVGTADLVVANNVLAHVPDPIDFLSGVAALLAPHGRISIESPYALHMLRGVQFDTIYHEHTFYLTMGAVASMASRSGLEIVDVTPLSTHGGSNRWMLAHTGAYEPSGRVTDMVQAEQTSDLLTGEGLEDFARRSAHARDLLIAEIEDGQDSGRVWAGYGAAAKGVVLANYASLGSDDIAFVVDNNPLKQGNVLPGTDIPVVAEQELTDRDDVSDVLVMAWNIAAEVSKRIDSACRAPVRKWVAIPEMARVP